MAITSIGTYVTTADAIISHWTDVDADRLANTLPAITLRAGQTLAEFTTQRDELQTAITDLIALENTRSVAANDRNSQKENLLLRLGKFRKAMDLHLSDSSYFSAMPTIPNKGLAESKLMRAFDDAADLWSRVDADTSIPGFTPPLVLTAGYPLSAFVADIATMRALFREVTDAENDQDIRRKQRDGMLEPLRDRMQQYRAAIDVEYGAGHPFFESLPSLSPTPGSTPDSVTASIEWDPVAIEAVLSWTESTNPALENYQVRMSPGPTYDSETATPVDTLPPGTVEVRTTAGLANPGDTASFRVYVILSTGNEAGSETVTVAHP